MATPRPLNAKQRAFTREYRVDYNATQAAIRAGYSPKTAATIGWALLQKADIQKVIKNADAKTAAKIEVTAEKLIARWAQWAFTDGTPPAQATKASQMLGQYLRILSKEEESTETMTDEQRAAAVAEIMAKAKPEGDK